MGEHTPASVESLTPLLWQNWGFASVIQQKLFNFVAYLFKLKSLFLC